MRSAATCPTHLSGSQLVFLRRIFCRCSPSSNFPFLLLSTPCSEFPPQRAGINPGSHKNGFTIRQRPKMSTSLKPDLRQKAIQSLPHGQRPPQLPAFPSPQQIPRWGSQRPSSTHSVQFPLLLKKKKTQQLLTQNG